MNEVLRRLRLLGRTFTLSPVDLPDGPWRIHYSNDDGSELPVKPGLKAGMVGSGFRWSFALVTPEFWQLAASLRPDTPERPWEELLLNAQRLLPEVGPALVMAHTALETFI